jgi:transposase
MLCYIVGMYIAVIPNRNSPPAILLRESYREGSQVKNRTLANLSHWPAPRIEALRALLRGENLSAAKLPLPEAFTIERSLPHGHVAAVLGTLKGTGLDTLLGKPSPPRELVLAMLVERLIAPQSKLACARGLCQATQTSTLGSLLRLPEAVDEDSLYAALDWLLARQEAVEIELAKRHLHEASLVLYDVSSTYFEGRSCPLARFGHSRDSRSDRLQIVFGLLTSVEGCPVAVEVFEGNTGDPKTLAPQIEKLRQRFGLQHLVLVGDRGMITEARIRHDLAPALLEWISALRAPAIAALAREGVLQPSLFDERDLAEVSSSEFPGERLIVCKNPLLAEERASKRNELLAATERELDKIAKATQRPRRPLRGKTRIALRVGKVLNRYHMAKHYRLTIEENAFGYARDEARIAVEAALDGVYVIRTNVPAAALRSEQVVRAYKRLSAVERAFRSLKSVDLHLRPIFHHKADRVRAHVFLCMLAYYVEWHMRHKLASLLFDEEDWEAAEQRRASVVAPAQRSPSSLAKIASKRNADGFPVHSFRTLLQDLATLTRNRIVPKDTDMPPFDMLSVPTALQQRAFTLLGLRL